jgi:hypothetical protein
MRNERMGGAAGNLPTAAKRDEEGQRSKHAFLEAKGTNER